ncbi:MAG: peptidylprolyl isomerase [Armatimonadetes bacterium]|nr:peptidylprolyl isomerase [Armatimonadota bacterium]
MDARRGESETADTVKKPAQAPAPIKLAPEDGDEVAIIDTELGRIVVMFHPERAPNHVENFKTLARKGFYDGTRFHRVIPRFMIQGGDPDSKDMNKSNSWGTGGNLDANGREINIDAEFSEIKHVSGILSMARSPAGYDTASSQFFIMHGTSTGLDGQYSVFGRVVEGMDVVDEIVDVSVLKDPGNGIVFPKFAVVIDKITVVTWPIRD